MKALDAELLQTIHRVGTRELFTIAGTPISILTLVTFASVIALAFYASRLVQATLVRFLRLRGMKDEGTLGVSSRLAHYLVVSLGFVIGLQMLGIDLTTVFAAGAFFAVAIGFAMQNILQNFVSGVILLAERTIKPGDVLAVEGRMVRVVRLLTRATVARTLDEEDIIIPNSILVQSTVTNYTLRDKLFRVRAGVGVTYDSDMKAVRETLMRAASALPWRFPDKDPLVYMSTFGSSSVDFEVSVWIEDAWSEKRRRSDMNEALWWALKDAGITIAFPQVDVHFDRPVVESLARLSAPRDPGEAASAGPG